MRMKDDIAAMQHIVDHCLFGRPEQAARMRVVMRHIEDRDSLIKKLQAEVVSLHGRGHELPKMPDA